MSEERKLCRTPRTSWSYNWKTPQLIVLGNKEQETQIAKMLTGKDSSNGALLDYYDIDYFGDGQKKRCLYRERRGSKTFRARLQELMPDRIIDFSNADLTLEPPRGTGDYLIYPTNVPRKYPVLPVAFIPSDSIFGEGLCVICDTTELEYGVLSSGMFAAWVNNSRSLRPLDTPTSRNLYFAPKLFPWPLVPTAEETAELKRCVARLCVLHGQIREKLSEGNYEYTYLGPRTPEMQTVLRELDSVIDGLYPGYQPGMDRYQYLRKFLAERRQRWEQEMERQKEEQRYVRSKRKFKAGFR